MNQGIIAIVFTIIFSTFTVVPSILSVVDDSYDISILISSAEEEEKKGQEKVKDSEIELPLKSNIAFKTYKNCLLKLLNNNSNNYSSLFQELVLPPPELNI